MLVLMVLFSESSSGGVGDSEENIARCEDTPARDNQSRQHRIIREENENEDKLDDNSKPGKGKMCQHDMKEMELMRNTCKGKGQKISDKEKTGEFEGREKVSEAEELAVSSVREASNVVAGHSFSIMDTNIRFFHYTYIHARSRYLAVAIFLLKALIQ